MYYSDWVKCSNVTLSKSFTTVKNIYVNIYFSDSVENCIHCMKMNIWINSISGLFFCCWTNYEVFMCYLTWFIKVLWRDMIWVGPETNYSSGNWNLGGTNCRDLGIMFLEFRFWFWLILGMMVQKIRICDRNKEELWGNNLRLN